MAEIRVICKILEQLEELLFTPKAEHQHSGPFAFLCFYKLVHGNMYRKGKLKVVKQDELLVPKKLRSS